MARSRRNAGFTLVELLVVIAIIGVLVSLLLPAVQAAREAARRTTCTNRLRQIAIATMNHESTHKHYPTGGWGWFWAGDPDRGYGKDQPGGWMYNVMPYMESSAGYNLPSDGKPDELTQQQKQATLQLIQTPQPMLNCPSRRPAGGGQSGSFNGSTIAYNSVTPPTDAFVARGDYAFVCGDEPQNERSAGPGSLAAAERFRWGWDEAGNPQIGGQKVMNGISFEQSQIKISQVTDGTSTTYMIGEKYLDPLHYDTGERGNDNETWCTGFNNDNYRTTYEPPEQDRPGVDGGQRFGSAHAAVWQMAFCDGHVESLSYDVDPFVHRASGNRHDGAVDFQSLYQPRPAGPTR